MYCRYVASALDDYEGSLTRDGVTNFHGIVSFEVNKVFTNDLEEPTTGWKKILPLAEKDSFRNAISDGKFIICRLPRFLENMKK